MNILKDKIYFSNEPGLPLYLVTLLATASIVYVTVNGIKLDPAITLRPKYGMKMKLAQRRK
jgi:hypothetical protein